MRPQMEADRDVTRMPDANGDNPAEQHDLAVGPLHFGGTTSVGGRRRRLASFRVDGLTIFGGSVAGSVDGRSANIVLSWPASP
jgi:hypothetical protein